MIIKLKDLPINKSNVLNSNKEREIYEYYLGEKIEEGKLYMSHYRREENPSLSFKVMDSGMIVWRDWGDTSMYKAADVVTFVMKFFNCSSEEALERIRKDFNIEADIRPIQSFKSVKTEEKKKRKKIIFVEKQPFTKEDYLYWNSYGIDLETLIKYDVSSAKYVWVDNVLVKTYKRASPVYAYEIQLKGFPHYKIYSPYNGRIMKWLYNGPNSYLHGYKDLPESGPLLFITKALKDTMVLDTFGYDVVNTQSESVIFKEDIARDLAIRFGRIIVLYDNDLAGVLGAQRLQERFGFEIQFIPKISEAKDISDYVFNYGVEAGKELMEKIVK